MALTHRYSRTIRTDAGTGVTDTTTYSGDAEVNVSDIATAGASREVDVAVDVSELVSFWMYSDKDLDVKTNSSGSPAQTFNLTGGKTLAWNTDDINTNPITTDITKLFLDNTAGEDNATFKAGFLLDVGS